MDQVISISGLRKRYGDREAVRGIDLHVHRGEIFALSSVATARESGVLKRRRATPASAALLVAGQAMATVVIAGIMGILLLVIWISPTDLWVLALWGVGAGLLAAWRFSWLPSVATA